VILPAECRDGVGSQGFYDYMATAGRPQDVIDRFKREGYTEGSSKAWMYARCVNRAELILVTQSIDDETLRRMFTTRADTVEQAIAAALAKHGPDAKIVLLRNSGDMIPRFQG
jgi:nickel-dependent lactate racemase